MKKRLSFTTSKAVLLIFVLGIIGAGSWFVLHRPPSTTTAKNEAANNSTAPQSSAKNTTSPTYNDDYVSFSYPSGWKVEKQYGFTDPYGAYLLNITAPADNTLKTKQPNITEPLYLHASILIAKNDRFPLNTVTCEANASPDCSVVYAKAVPLKSPQTEGTLLIVPDKGGTDAQWAIYSPSKIAPGALTYPTRIKVNDAYYASISGDIMSGSMSLVSLTSKADFQNSSAFKDLMSIISTVAFKTAKLQ